MSPSEQEDFVKSMDITQRITKREVQQYIDKNKQLGSNQKENYFIDRRNIEVDRVDDFVFFSENGYLLHAISFRRELLKFQDSYNKKAKHKIECLTPHMLRHTGCTRMAEIRRFIRIWKVIRRYIKSVFLTEM